MLTDSCTLGLNVNGKQMEVSKNAKVISDDAESFVAHAVDKYDFIFADPPYGKGYLEKLLPGLGRRLFLRMGITVAFFQKSRVNPICLTQTVSQKTRADETSQQCRVNFR